MAIKVNERVRENVRVELAELMYPLFSTEGLDQVTVAQAARAASISRATFFRYFSSKEDAVITALRSLGTPFADALGGLDTLPGESLLELLRGAFEPSVLAVEQEPQAMRARVAFVWTNPSLRENWSSFRHGQHDRLARALEPYCSSTRLAQTSAVIALTLYDHALERWIRNPEGSFRQILDEIFDFASLIDVPWSQEFGV